MKRLRLYHQIRKYWLLSLSLTILALLLIIPVRLTIAYLQSSKPQAILVLGGGEEREEAAARLSQYYPSLNIWVSSGNSPEMVQTIFQNHGVSRQRLFLDYRATDTVTNFTTLVPDFEKRQIQHLYLITSSSHMNRAMAIGSLVLGSRGIILTPVSIPSNSPKEPFYEILRDLGRSLLWIFTNRSGESFKPLFRK